MIKFVFICVSLVSVNLYFSRAGITTQNQVRQWPISFIFRKNYFFHSMICLIHLRTTVVKNTLKTFQRKRANSTWISFIIIIIIIIVIIIIFILRLKLSTLMLNSKWILDRFLAIRWELFFFFFFSKNTHQDLRTNEENEQVKWKHSDSSNRWVFSW